ncbi:MAG: hypothetical protein U0183_22255 [Polyangiaceae bacterium]
MSTKVVTVCAIGALFLAACLVAPGEPVPSAPGDCPTGQKAFNGECRTVCAATSDCAAGTSCMHVGGGETLCLDYEHCGYLGDDTDCAGTGPYFSGYSDEPAPYGYGGGADECRGNARWQTIAPSTEPRCGQSHPVSRCRKVGGACRIERGTTLDVADP